MKTKYITGSGFACPQRKHAGIDTVSDSQRTDDKEYQHKKALLTQLVDIKGKYFVVFILLAVSEVRRKKLFNARSFNATGPRPK